MIRLPAAFMLTCAALATIVVGGCAHTPTHRSEPAMHADSADRARIHTVLDTLHAAASKAEEDRYFSCFAPDAVFLGTDATERWTLGQFKAYAHPIFSKGKGWTYEVTERHVSVAPSARHAWFDEMLSNAKYGTCRGSGVLSRSDDGRWLIEQYNLSVPVPNDLLAEFAETIRRFEAASKPAAEPSR